MATKGEWTRIGGDLPGFVAIPSGPPPWPALLVVHAAMGLDHYIEDLCASFADEGYYVACPDIYAPDPGFKQHGPEDLAIAAHLGADAAKQEAKLAQYPADQQTRIIKAREWMNARQGHTYINTVRGTYDHLSRDPKIRAIGTIGFCMGGRLVGELVVTGAKMAAGVIHYGGPPKLDLVPKIVTPLEGHYASTDTPITSRIPAFAEAMKAAGKAFSYYVYEADHGFSIGKTRFPEQAKLALDRSRKYLAEKLRPMAAAAE
jgi:carboxymethylenebutenolidase